MTYRVYTAELRQFGAPAIIIVTSWQTPDEVLHAEWFAIQGTQLASEPISSANRNHPDLPFESEDDMVVEALRGARVNGIRYRSTCVRRRRRKGTRCFWRKRGYGVALLHLRKLPLIPDALNYAPSSTELSDCRLLLALMKRFTSSNKLTGSADRGERSEAATMLRRADQNIRIRGAALRSKPLGFSSAVFCCGGPEDSRYCRRIDGWRHRRSDCRLPASTGLTYGRRENPLLQSG